MDTNIPIDLIHDSSRVGGHIGFKIIMQISQVVCEEATIGRKILSVNRVTLFSSIFQNCARASDNRDLFILLFITEVTVMLPQKSRDYFACLTTGKQLWRLLRIKATRLNF